MNRTIQLLIACGLASSILACAQPTQQRGEGNQGSEPEPKYGGMLSYAPAGSAQHVHPYTSTGSATNIVVKPVYEPLLKTYLASEATDATPEGAVGPWLAESWTNPNPTTYVFKIRQGVKWQDGTDFTAADVVFTWDYLLQNKGQFSIARNLSQVASFRAVDTYTVELVSKSADADFLATAIVPVIIPKHLVEAGADLTKVMMGTGAFKLKDFNLTRGPVHVRNENYWNKGLPYLDGIIGYYSMDRSTMIAAMTVGKLDLFNPENAPQLQTVQAGVPNLGYVSYHTGSNYSLRPKLTQPPFSDLRVRQAINLAIDRQGMNTTLTGGKGMINPPGVIGWLTSFALPQEELLKRPGFNPATKQQDIAEAKRLLAEAGYPNGFKANLIYPGQNTGNPPLAEVSSTQLRAIGIDFTLKPAEDNLWNDQVILKGQFEVKLDGGGGVTFGRFFQTDLHSKGVQNKQGIADPVLDELIEKQAVTLDAKERQKIVQDIQRRMLDNAYTIPLIEQVSSTTWQPWVHNYVYGRGQQVGPSYTPQKIWLDTSMFPEGRLQEEAKMIK